MRRIARWIALASIVPAFAAGWCLAGWLAPRLLGSPPMPGWNAYAAYIQALSQPAWQPHATSIYVAGVLGLGLPLLLAITGVVAAWRARDAAEPGRSAFAPSRWLAQAGYTGSAMGRVIWGRQGASPLSSGGHVMVACHADDAWYRDYAIPNLLHWDGPVLVVDQRGAAWAAASGYRATRGPSWYVDPFAADGLTAGWNPLAMMATAPQRRDPALTLLARRIYADTAAHVRHEVIGMFVAVAGYLLDAYADALAHGLEPAMPTLPQVESLFRPQQQSLKHELKRFSDKSFIGAATRAQLLGLLTVPRDRFDYLATLAHVPLRELAAGPVARALSGKGVDLAAWAAGEGSLHIALPSVGAPEAATWLASDLIENALQALLSRPEGPTALCILDGPDACGALPSLQRVLYEGGARRIRVLQRTNGFGEWSQAYGEADVDRLMAAFDLRVFSGVANPAGSPSGLFAFPAGENTRFDHRRWPLLASHVARQESATLVALQRGIERPIRANTLRYAKDPRLATRQLPPAVVSPPSGEDAVPSKTLMTLSASAALALGAAACSASGQGGDAAARSEMHAPVYSDKLVDARLGPTTFAFPMNLYTYQTGPDFQGGVSLTLRWPSLDAFPPGATNEGKFKDAYMDESISISPSYIDKVPIDTLLLKYTRASYRDAHDPIDQLSERVKQPSVNGLTPYYVDLGKVTDYFRARGYSTERDRVLEASDDWYVAYGNDGAIATLIKCDNHEIKGAGLVDNKLEWTPVGQPRGLCHHSFVVPERKLVVDITYLRAYLGDWRRIEARARQLFEQAANQGVSK